MTSTLKATSIHDSYRPCEVQKRLFLSRYTNTPNGTRPRHWQGKKPHVAAAAVPGTSNHGWGLAVDNARRTTAILTTDSLDNRTLRWLVQNEQRFGFSHELQSEPWHIRYLAGDDIPAAVRAFEQGIGKDADMPLTDDEAEKIATATWFRDTDPTATKR